jgi:hypothetical protein
LQNTSLNCIVVRKPGLSAMPHVTKINSSFALREVIDRTGTGIRADMA